MTGLRSKNALAGRLSRQEVGWKSRQVQEDVVHLLLLLAGSTGWCQPNNLRCVPCQVGAMLPWQCAGWRTVRLLAAAQLAVRVVHPGCSQGVCARRSHSICYCYLFCVVRALRICCCHRLRSVVGGSFVHSSYLLQPVIVAAAVAVHISVVMYSCSGNQQQLCKLQLASGML